MAHHAGWDGGWHHGGQKDERGGHHGVATAVPIMTARTIAADQALA